MRPNIWVGAKLTSIRNIWARRFAMVLTYPVVALLELIDVNYFGFVNFHKGFAHWFNHKPEEQEAENV